MVKISIVDPPGPGASVSELEAFLKKAKGWPKDDVAVRTAVRRVERDLAARRKMERSLASRSVKASQ
jgi:hypothetical protein